MNEVQTGWEDTQANRKAATTAHAQTLQQWVTRNHGEKGVKVNHHKHYTEANSSENQNQE